jgi:hypothetical protein
LLFSFQSKTIFLLLKSLGQKKKVFPSQDILWDEKTPWCHPISQRKAASTFDKGNSPGLIARYSESGNRPAAICSHQPQTLWIRKKRIFFRHRTFTYIVYTKRWKISSVSVKKLLFCNNFFEPCIGFYEKSFSEEGIL